MQIFENLSVVDVLVIISVFRIDRRSLFTNKERRSEKTEKNYSHLKTEIIRRLLALGESKYVFNLALNELIHDVHYCYEMYLFSVRSSLFLS